MALGKTKTERILWDYICPDHGFREILYMAQEKGAGTLRLASKGGSCWKCGNPTLFLAIRE